MTPNCVLLVTRLITVTLACTNFATANPESALDHSAWSRVLAQFENEQARVDYKSLKSKGSADLVAYLRQMSRPWPQALTSNERKAALINTYNALTVQWIVDNYPVESIWRTNHPFTAVRHLVNGRKVSLDQLETDLRNMGDPRIHAVLVCASLSCPPLRRKAYLPEELDRQLSECVQNWLGNPTLNRFHAAEHKAEVSMIFEWYKGDFEKDGSSVPLFLARFAPEGQTGFLGEPGLKLSYQEYNWGLNDTSSIGAKYSKASFYKDYLRNKF